MVDAMDCQEGLLLAKLYQGELLLAIANPAGGVHQAGVARRQARGR